MMISCARQIAAPARAGAASRASPCAKLRAGSSSNSNYNINNNNIVRRHHAVSCPASASNAPASAPGSSASELRSELLSLLGKGDEGAARMARSGDRARLEQLVTSLEAVNPTPSPFKCPDLLLGDWQLLTTFQPGTGDVRFTDPESWRKYLFESGPSPVQSLVVGNQDVSNVFQVLEDPKAAGSKWENVVDFGAGNSLVIEAVMEGVRDTNSFFYRFSGGYFRLDGALGGPDGIKLPYPVPFDLLEALRPGQTKGWFATTYLDEELRVSRGNKGSVFVLRRPVGYWELQKEKQKYVRQ